VRAFEKRIGPGQVQHPVGVVVAADQPIDAVEAGEDLGATRPARAGGKVAQVPDLVLGADGLVPACDQGSIVLGGRGQPAASA